MHSRECASVQILAINSYNTKYPRLAQFFVRQLYGHDTIVQILLEHGADVNPQSGE
jgi:hypothetical protein